MRAVVAYRGTLIHNRQLAQVLASGLYSLKFDGQFIWAVRSKS
jgi:hypothetical protein